MILALLLFMAIFLVIEARRYRLYHVTVHRIRMFEQGFFAQVLTGKLGDLCFWIGAPCVYWLSGWSFVFMLLIFGFGRECHQWRLCACLLLSFVCVALILLLTIALQPRLRTSQQTGRNAFGEATTILSMALIACSRPRCRY